ncbi:MAG: DUF302 domain-containing protein [Candidatus Hodarchaeales archaeon]|jgi:uncharacterized protein (DUF302 family)
MVEILRKELEMDFDSAVKHIEKVVSDEGFSVLMVKAIDEVIKNKLGVEDYPKYTSIMACGADLAKMALDVSKDVGTLFPCSFVVYEEDNKVMVAHVSIMKMSTELGIVSKDKMAHVIEETSIRVQSAWGKF